MPARARLLLALSVVLAVLGWSSEGAASIRRFGLVIGNNRGEPSEVELRYAETDAQRVSDVLKDLGGFEPADIVLLRGEKAPRAQATLISLNDRIRSAVAAGSEVFLFVYYSGHATSDALHLSGTRLDLRQLEQLVRGSSATFRVLVLDACRSGALTRVKGGTAAPAFDIRVDERLAGQGLVFLTSSAANEDAQESDALKGSFFTHHFVSGLLGAADADGDGRVSVEESYRYAYEATLRSSSESIVGLQHPTFRYELQGAGKIVVTEPRANAGSRAMLAFPVGRTYLVMAHSARGNVVAEVSEAAKSRRIAVPPGRYFVRARLRDALLEGEIDVRGGGAFEVTDDRLHRVAYARLVRKGEGVRKTAHGLDAGYAFHTALPNQQSLCHGIALGYTLHLEDVSFAARGFGCRGTFANDVLSATADEIGGELRALHAFDLPVVVVDAGLGLGGALLRQRFETSGIAPARSSGAGTIAFFIGLQLDLGAGFSLFAESALATYLYAQAENGQDSLRPHPTFRQTLGLSCVW